MIKDEMVGWHHWLNRHEFEQTLGDGKGQGSLVCCSRWGHKESDRTEQLNNKICIYVYMYIHITYLAMFLLDSKSILKDLYWESLWRNHFNKYKASVSTSAFLLPLPTAMTWMVFPLIPEARLWLELTKPGRKGYPCHSTETKEH